VALSESTSSRYAARTTVTPEKTRAEIERTLARYGATGFGYLTEATRATILFKMPDSHKRQRVIRLTLLLPDERRYTKAGYQQEVRQRWRALLLVIKAKLEAVASGISTLEIEFMAQTVLPSGETVSDWLTPQLDTAFDMGSMPMRFLPGAGETTP
jgi:hypothetical protein